MNLKNSIDFVIDVSIASTGIMATELVGPLMATTFVSSHDEFNQSLNLILQIIIAATTLVTLIYRIKKQNNANLQDKDEDSSSGPTDQSEL